MFDTPHIADDPLAVLPWLLVGLLVLVVMALWRMLALQRAAPGQASRARNARALRGESAAELLLEELGYDVLERQVRALWWIEIDGDEVEVEVRADLMVEDGEGRRYVAEVKTGDLAPHPTHAGTRRQLLEYACVFTPMGVLLVDVEAESVVQVRFPGVGDDGDLDDPHTDDGPD